MRSSSTRGKLLIAGVIVVAIIAALAGFLILRATVLSTTGTSGGALARGTYHGSLTYAGKTIQQTITAKSDCPACAVTVTGDGLTSTYNWDGDHWQYKSDNMCGPFVSTLTATKVVDGLAQELTTRTTYSAPPTMCGDPNLGGAELVLTRTGD